MHKNFFSALPLISASLMLVAGPALAQNAQPDLDSTKEELLDAIKDLEDDKKESKESDVKSITKFAKGKDRSEGLFPVLQDPENGKTYLEISADKLGQEFIYFTYTKNGVSLPGLRTAGNIGENMVFSLRRRYDHIDLIEKNTEYQKDASSRLEEVNVPNSPRAALDIVAQSKDGKIFIVELSKWLVDGDFIELGKVPQLFKAFGLKDGKLNKTKSSIREIRNYPANTDIIAEYVIDYSGPVRASVPSATISIQHSLLTLPSEGYVPRRDDPRVGFFSEQKTNLSVDTGLPYADLIRRWRLEKKDPAAEISDPVKPITYWIENTTPLEFRDTIAAAVLRWNPVFEKAGFRNALKVDVQPDDAEWDAGDIRYNVIRWVASPNPGYLGYGPSATDPRTGEILAADIVLENSSSRNWLTYDRILNDKIAASGQPDITDIVNGTTGAAPTSLAAPNEMAGHDQFGQYLASGVAAARIALQTENYADPRVKDEKLKDITRDGLYYLVLHEVGHTLGLTHNMGGSFYQPLNMLNQGSTDEGVQYLSNSVMDYPAVNISAPGEKQGPYYPIAAGPYDYWAIAFGYNPEMDNPTVLQQHLGRSADPDLRFGNDADALNNPSVGIDPRVMAFDLSAQPIEFAVRELEMVQRIRKNLIANLSTQGESWEEIVRANALLNNIYQRQAQVISRYVGGVKVDRSFVGQTTSASKPLDPVDGATQRRSIALIRQYVLAPDALRIPAELASHLQRQRRGFSGAPAPSLHKDALKIQNSIIGFLLHARTLQRMVDSAEYGNNYSVSEMIGDVTDAVFEDDLRNDVNSYRRILQANYVGTLFNVVDRGDPIAQASALFEINRIDRLMKKYGSKGSIATRAHRSYLRQVIKKTLENGRSK